MTDVPKGSQARRLGLGPRGELDGLIRKERLDGPARNRRKDGDRQSPHGGGENQGLLPVRGLRNAHALALSGLGCKRALILFLAFQIVPL